MSNQRSCILFVALVIILAYLYYESLKQKTQSEDEQTTENSLPSNTQNEESRIMFGRRLLSYSKEYTADISSNTTIFNQFKAMNKFPEGSRGNLRRIKRNAMFKKGPYKWKFDVSVSRLGNDSTKPTDKLKNSLDENIEEKEFLNITINVNGKTKQFKEVEHSWDVVRDSLKSFYREPKEPRENNLLNPRVFSTSTSQVDADESRKENLHLKSTEHSSFIVTENSHEPSKENKTSRGRKGKLLFLNFGGGGNKENPPLELQNGENVVSIGTSQPMDDISFLNSTEQFDIKAPDDIFSSTLLPEHKELDLPLSEPHFSLAVTPEPNVSLIITSEPNNSLTIASGPKVDSIKISKHSTLSPTIKNGILDCDNCIVKQEKQTSTKEFEVITDLQIDPLENIIETITAESIIDISSGSIEMFCINFVQSLRKSPRFESQFGSLDEGQSEVDAIQNLILNDIGSGSLNANKNVESFEANTQTVTTVKTAQQQFGLLQRLWNTIPNFRNRNQRKVDEDIDISGFPAHFSVKDCKDLFTDQIKSNFSTLQTSSEKVILTESDTTTLPFSSDIIKNDVENRSNNSLDQKEHALKNEENTSFKINDQFVQLQKKSTTETIQSSSQNALSFHENSIVTPNSIVSIDNSKETLIELSLGTDKSVQLQKAFNTSDSEILSTISLENPLADLNTKSLISQGLEDKRQTSQSILEELKIVSTESVNQENKRFLSDLNSNEILELGSADERLISNVVTEIDVFEVIDHKTTPNLNERIFFPNFNLFNEGSGARELPELQSPTDVNLVKNTFKFLETNNQNESIIIEETFLIKETTIGQMQERIFIPNFFNGGSGSRELSELYTSADANVNKELDSSESNIFVSLEAFDIGSGMRNRDEMETSSETKNLNIDSRNDDAFSASIDNLVSYSVTDNLANEEVLGDILHKTKTDATLSANEDAFRGEFGSGASDFNSEEGRKMSGSDESNEASNVTISSKSEPRFASLFESDASAIENGPIHFEPEPEISIQLSEPTQAGRGARFDDTKYIPNSPLRVEINTPPFDVKESVKFEGEADTVKNRERDFESQTEISALFSKNPFRRRGARLDNLHPEISDFASQAVVTSSNSKIYESTISNLFNRIENTKHKNKLAPEPKQSFSFQTSSTQQRRRARFNDPSPEETGVTSKSETTVSKIPITTVPMLPISTVPKIPISTVPSQASDVNLFQSRRGARGHDLFDLVELDSIEEKSVSETVTINTRQESVTSSNLFEKNTLSEAKMEIATNHSLTTESINGNSDSNSINPSEINTFSFEMSRTTGVSPSVLTDNSSVTNSIPSTSSNKIYPKRVNLNPELKLPSPKLCHSASECNVTLNERCMPNDDFLMCDCGKAFRRNIDTKKCEITISLRTTLTLPGEKFYADLRNTSTGIYQQRRKDYIEMMWFLLKHDPKLFFTVAEVDIAGFEEGSLVVKYTITLLDNRNETASEMVGQLQNDLNKIIKDPELLRNLSLDFKNASLSSYVLNPCLSNDMNYCHKNAICIPTEEKGFKCHCESESLDISADKNYPGENCTGSCASNYCGAYGECHVNERGEKRCICSGWYFGEKCEISGLVVIAGFAFANVLVIVFVVIVVFFCKKKKNRKFYHRNMTNFQPGQDRLSGHPTARDAIALDEVVHSGPSKFFTISTPIENPIIQFTSPTFSGSSIGYDSTFDSVNHHTTQKTQDSPYSEISRTLPESDVPRV